MSIQFSSAMLLKILPLYKRLASTELLSRCTQGGTENTSESLHFFIWQNCPKEALVSKRRSEMAISEYHMGCIAAQEIKSSTTWEEIAGIEEKQHRKEIHSHRPSLGQQKSTRKNKKLRRASAEVSNKKRDWNSYGAGQFWHFTLGALSCINVFSIKFKFSQSDIHQGVPDVPRGILSFTFSLNLAQFFWSTISRSCGVIVFWCHIVLGYRGDFNSKKIGNFNGYVCISDNN